jgi:hypothetical protein
LTKAQWLADRKSELLPVPYFHCVFTLPHDLNSLVLANKAVLLQVLFAAVSETLLEFGRNNLGGKMGFTMVLHTWDQLLQAHFHVHCVVPAGALSKDAWVRGNPRFLFPVRALSKVFRGKLLTKLQTVHGRKLLRYPGRLANLALDDAFDDLILRLRTVDWVVYAKRPFAGPEHVLDYLGRYTHRVAISNHRLVDVTDDAVAFNYRDRKNENVQRTATLPPLEFISRFLLHVLPKGFQRIRHVGFLASRCKTADLARCRLLLGAEPPAPRLKLTVREWMLKLTGADVDLCPACGEHALIRQPIPPNLRPSRPCVGRDTS